MKRSISIVIGLILLTGLVWGVMAGRETEVVHNTQSTTATFGEPGLAFRYVEEYGISETAYIEDSAYLHDPSSVTIDNNGNIWVSEWQGMRTSKFNASGVFQMSLGRAGFGDSEEEILGPVSETVVDSSGNIWVAESEDNRVVKFNSAGEYQSEIGHKWESGSDNDHFDGPRGLALDSSDNLYVSDGYNNRVQIFNSTGTHVATLGVTGETGTDDMHFNNPQRIYIDNADRLYVGDAGNFRVQIFNVANPLTITYIATLGVTGESGSDDNHFDWPIGVAADANKIYVVDLGNQRLQIFNATTYAHSATIGTGSAGAGNNEFDAPSNVDVDASGNIYVSEYGNHRVQKFTSSYAYESTLGVTDVPYITTSDHYNAPRGLAIASDGGLIAVEHDGLRVIKINPDGTQAWTHGKAGVRADDETHHELPSGVAVDSVDRVYVTDHWTNRIHILNANGTHHSFFGEYGTGNEQFDEPNDLAFDENGRLYVADTWNHRVQIYDSNLNYLATLGVTDVSGSDNAHFNAPHSVAVDSTGTIYVADGDNDRVQVFNNNYVYQRTIGLSASGCNDAFDRFCGAHDVAVDAQDRLYVADTWNNRVQVYDSTGAYLTTIGGKWGGDLGEKRSVEGVAVDESGNVYISDSNNHRIYKYALGVPGWKQVNLNGFGNTKNWGVWSLGSFNDVLYGSTSNSNMGADIYRYVSGNWEQVASGGFGDDTNVAANWFTEFNGSLYASTWNDGGGGGQIWRTSTGNNGSWVKVVDAGFNDAVNGEIMAMVSFDGYLYAGTWSNDTNSHGAEVWRSANGNSGSWVRVVDDSIFGESHNAGILSMAVFNNYLYVVTENQETGGEVWRTSNGTVWTQANADGFGSSDNTRVVSLSAFNSAVYAGTWNGAAGAQIWRSTNGTSWEVVMSNGFDGGDADNQEVASLVEFDNKLIAITGNFETGPEVWQSTTGNNGDWQLVIDNGFGGGKVAAVNWDNVTAVVDNQLYVGTYASWGNGGGRVWQIQRQVFLPMIIK